MWAPDCWAHQSQLVLGNYFKVYGTASYIAELATSLIGWLNNHGKVRKLFNEAQGQISLDCTGYVVVLAYLIANLTCWTTHCVAFICLHSLRGVLKLAVLQWREAIIKAQVGAATFSDKCTLQADAEKHCDIIEDSTFWTGLKVVIGDIEPICFATNINQSDCSHPDQVLLTLVGMYLHFSNHPELTVQDGMKKHLEKRWKDCDQSLFLLTLILNPFEGMSRFREQSGMNHFRCNTLLILVRSYHLVLNTLLILSIGVSKVPIKTLGSHQCAGPKGEGEGAHDCYDAISCIEWTMARLVSRARGSGADNGQYFGLQVISRRLTYITSFQLLG